MTSIILHCPPVIVDTKLFGWFSYDTVFTVLITLLIFVIGVIVQKWLESKKESKRLNKVREYIVLQVQFLYKPLDTQIGYVNDFITEIKTDVDQDLHLATSTSLTTKRIDEISSKDLFEAIQLLKIKEDKTKLFQELTNAFDLLAGVKDNLGKNMDFYNEHYSSYEKNYKEYVLESSNLYDVWRTSNEQHNIPIAEDLFLLALDRIRGLWVRQENYKDMYVALEHYLTPTTTMCREHEGDTRAIKLLHLMLEANYGITNIKHIRELVQGLVEKDVENLIDIKETFTNCLEQLEK